MKIAAASIALASTSTFEARSLVRETTVIRPVRPEGVDRFVPSERSTDRAFAKLAKLLDKAARAEPGSRDAEKLESKIARLVARIDARLAGQRVPEDATVELRYREERRYVEQEAISFRAAGSVTTDDGRQIDFTQALDLARVYARAESTVIRATGNLSAIVERLGATAGPTAETAPSDQPTTEPERRPVLSVAGGVLGIDRDDDGTIDPNTELVRGFEDLSQLDDDGNGFIDEGDAAFGQLAVVRQGEDGLTATDAGAAGVGAIYLDSVATPFTNRTTSGDVSSQLVRSGLFLYESGETGIAQQIDLLI